MCFGGKHNRGEVSLSCDISHCMLPVWLVAGDVSLGHPAKAVLAWIPPVFLPFSYFVLWKQVTTSTPHLVWGMGTCWGRVSAHIIWNSCEEKTFLFSSLYSIIYLFQCGFRYIYFLLWVMIKPGLFILLLKLFHLSPLGDWLLSSFDVFPFFLFLELFLTFCHYKMLWTHLLFSLPTPRISHLSQTPISSHWRMVFRNQQLAVCLLLVGHPLK